MRIAFSLLSGLSPVPHTTHEFPRIPANMRKSSSSSVRGTRTGDASPSLPPRVKGPDRGVLTASLGPLRLTGGTRGEPHTCRLVWWGDDAPVEVQLVANSAEAAGEVRYSVRSSPAAFARYLGDAEKVFLQLSESGGRGREVGFAAVWGLQRLAVGRGRLEESDLAVVDAEGREVGSMRMEMRYTAQEEETEEVEVCSGFRASRSDAALTEQRRERRHGQGASSAPSSPNKLRILSKGLLRSASEHDGGRQRKDVRIELPSRRLQAFKMESNYDDRGYLEDDDDSPGEVEEEGRRRMPHQHSLSQDFEGNVDGLRKILIRSRQRLAAAEGQREHMRTAATTAAPFRPRRPSLERESARAESVQFAEDYFQKRNEEVEQQDQSSKASQQHPLPNWNLSTSRLRFLSSVSQVVVGVHRVRLSGCATRAIFAPSDAKKKTREKRSRSASSSRSTASSTASSLAAKKPSTAAVTEGLSFFVSYAMPPATLATNHCSRKTSPQEGDSDGSSATVDFQGQRSVHPAVFRPALLDTWWTSNLTFRVLTRRFGQRDSLLIGESRVALKHLLTSERNGSGVELRLPVFAGQRFMSEHKPESEIVGDLYVSFHLAKADNIRTEDVAYLVSPQKAVRDGEEEGISEPEDKEPFSIEIDRRNVRVLRSQNSARSQQAARILDDELNNGYDSVASSESLVGGGSVPGFGRRLFCMLKVVGGRNFALKGGRTPSLFVQCRVLSAREMVRSEVRSGKYFFYKNVQCLFLL